MIELTVALPLYNSKQIAWLALESLCRQKNINFEWELVCAEELTPNPFTKKKCLSYENRLKNVGCKRIEFIELKKKIPLSLKWKLISKNASKTSEVFLLQAGDCYSQPYRLIESYNLIKNQKYEWIFSKIGPFFDILTGQVFLFDRTQSINYNRGLNMGTRTNYMLQLPDIKKNAAVDKWIIQNLERIVGRKLNTYSGTNEHWKLGFDTHGLNNISNRRKKFRNGIDPWHGTFNLDSYIDKDIMAELRTCAKYVTRKN